MIFIIIINSCAVYAQFECPIELHTKKKKNLKKWDNFEGIYTPRHNFFLRFFRVSLLKNKFLNSLNFYTFLKNWQKDQLQYAIIDNDEWCQRRNFFCLKLQLEFAALYSIETKSENSIVRVWCVRVWDVTNETR